MVAKKEAKVEIKQFRDKSSHWWCNMKHYYLNENNELIFAGGGIEITSETDFLKDFIRRNKKTYKEREVSPYINPKEYLEVFNFGKHSTKTVQYVFDNDKGYLKWILKNFDFAGKEKLKQEIINILK